MSLKSEDPLLRTARREALVVAGVFLLALGYTVGYCTLFGYDRPAGELKFIMGIPDWVFQGILLPWGVSTAVACWMSYGFIQDHELEEPAAPPQSQPQSPSAGETSDV